MGTLNSKIKLGSGDYMSYDIEGDVASSSKYLQISEIQKIINRNSIYPRFRIFVLNPDETVCYQISNEDILSGGSYNENYQNGSRRTLSFTLDNSSGKYTPSINNFWSGTRVSLQVGLEIPDESTTVWFDKGVFVMDTPKPSKTAEQKTVSISCSDKFSLFEGAQGTAGIATEFPAETKVRNLIEDILQRDMGNGYFVDPKPFLLDPSFEGRVLPNKISLTAENNWGSILTQIADILSAEVFYDAQGRMNFIPVIETMNDGSKPVLYDYSLDKLQTEDFSFDTSNFINKVYVIGANVNGHTCTAEAENNDPDSPLCISRIGLRSTVVSDSNITMDILAQERADYELRKNLVAKSTLDSGAFFNPLLSVNNIVTYIDEEDFNLRRERFLIQSLSFNLGYDGTMNLSVSNINNLPFVVS